MTGEKEFRELAANNEAFELMVKFGLGIYRGYDSCRGEFTPSLRCGILAPVSHRKRLAGGESPNEAA